MHPVQKRSVNSSPFRHTNKQHNNIMLLLFCCLTSKSDQATVEHGHAGETLRRGVFSSSSQAAVMIHRHVAHCIMQMDLPSAAFSRKKLNKGELFVRGRVCDREVFAVIVFLRRHSHTSPPLSLSLQGSMRRRKWRGNPFSPNHCDSFTSKNKKIKDIHGDHS